MVCTLSYFCSSTVIITIIIHTHTVYSKRSKQDNKVAIFNKYSSYIYSLNVVINSKRTSKDKRKKQL